MPSNVSVSARQTLTVVVPVYRNAETLAALHARLAATLDRLGERVELVYVDDACPDGSGEVLDGIAVDDPRVKVVRLPENIGQHRAIMKGLAASSGDRVVILDADLQDPPEAIPDLLNRLADGFDVVFAGRVGHYHDSPVKRVTSQVFKRMQRWLAGLPVDAGGYVALTRPVADRMLAMPPGPQTVVVMTAFAGRAITSVPVERARRPVGRSAFSSWRRFSLAIATLAWAARMRLTSRSR